ncbi:MAG: hypothetical protein ABSA02_20965 [Trebonia sp.]
MESGAQGADRVGGQAAEGAALQGGDGLPDRGGGQAPGRGEFGLYDFVLSLASGLSLGPLAAGGDGGPPESPAAADADNAFATAGFLIACRLLPVALVNGILPRGIELK